MTAGFSFIRTYCDWILFKITFSVYFIGIKLIRVVCGISLPHTLYEVHVRDKSFRTFRENEKINFTSCMKRTCFIFIIWVTRFTIRTSKRRNKKRRRHTQQTNGCGQNDSLKSFKTSLFVLK